MNIQADLASYFMRFIHPIECAFLKRETKKFYHQNWLIFVFFTMGGLNPTALCFSVKMLRKYIRGYALDTCREIEG